MITRRTTLYSPFRLALVALVFALGGSSALAQPQIDVTFRFLPDLTAPAIEPVIRAFTPGSFNDWGPNNNGQISPTAPSLMDFIEAEDEYRYTIPLTIGQTYTYKIHYHQNAAARRVHVDFGPAQRPSRRARTTTRSSRSPDPMAFQLAREQNDAGQVVAVSAGIFGTEAITAIQYQVNDGPLQDGLAAYDAESGIFRVELAGAGRAPGFLRVVATDASTERSRRPPASSRRPSSTPLARRGSKTASRSSTRARSASRSSRPFKSFVHVIGDFNDWTAGRRRAPLPRRRPGQPRLCGGGPRSPA